MKMPKGFETKAEFETTYSDVESAPREGWSFSLKRVGTVDGEAKHPILEEGAVRNYLNEPGTVRWIRLGDLASSESDACVDSRIEEPIVGNPAGDIGRMAEVVHAIGETKETRLMPQDFTTLLIYAVDNFGTFYFHTDEHAMEALAGAMSIDSSVMRMFPGIEKHLKDAESMHELILNPKLYEGEGDIKMTLGRWLIDPRNMGCGDFKKKFEDAKVYGVSEKALRSLLLSFYQLLWDGPEDIKSKLLHPMLMGSHEEGAVLSVMTKDEGISEESMVPMIRPSKADQGVHMFVEHPQVQEYLAEQMLQKILRDKPLKQFENVNSGRVLKRMKKMYDHGLQQTVNRLAPGLPVYQAEFVRE